MKRFNKFLALFLAVVMTVGLLPAISAAAADSNDILVEDFEGATVFPFKNPVNYIQHDQYYVAGAGSIITGGAHGGSKAAKLTATVLPSDATKFAIGRVKVLIPVENFEVGATYKLSAWFKSSHATGIRAYFNVQANPYTVMNVQESYTDVGTEWVQKEVEFVMPSGLASGTYITVLAGVSSYITDGITAQNCSDYFQLVDDIRISKVVYGYEDVEKELAAGDAVLQGDVDGTGKDLILKSGKTLDLNGKTLTVGSLSALGGAKVIDTAGNGKVVVADGNLALQADNGYLPIKVDGGYVFCNVDLTQNEQDKTVTDVLKYDTKPSFGGCADYLKDGAANNGLSILVRLTWTNGAGTTTTMDIPCSETDIVSVYGDEGTATNFSMTVSGVENVTGLKVSTVVCSDTGVVVAGVAE